MVSITPLSTGVLALIMAGEKVASPVLQVLGIKEVSGDESERYCMNISDGIYLNSDAMLVTQLNHLLAEGELDETTIIRVEKYATELDAGKRVLIILDLTVVRSADEVGRKIGYPVSYTEATPSNTSTSTELFNLICPIASLSSDQNEFRRWLKVRCTAKSPIRFWKSRNNEKSGTLCKIDLIDKSRVEISAKAFNNDCDKFLNVFQVGRVFYVANVLVNKAWPAYQTNDNENEIKLTPETVVQPCEDDDTDIPPVPYKFVPILEVAAMAIGAIVDVIGICKEAGEVETYTASTESKPFEKRDLTLVDKSNAAITVTLWNDEAVNFEGYSQAQPVILVKQARIDVFNAVKFLSADNNNVLIDPDIPEAHNLRGWFKNGAGKNVAN